MNRISKGILLKVALPIGSVVLLALALRASLKSETARIRIQESLSQALQMEVRFEKLRPTFFKGSRVSGLSASRPGGSSFTAREVYVRPRLLSLMRGQFVLSDIRIEDVRLVLVENSNPEATEPSKVSKKARAEVFGNGASKLTIRHLGIENASVDWIDAKGKVTLRVQGMGLHLYRLGEASGEGRLKVQGGVLLEAVPFRNLESLIEISQGRYTLPNLHCDSGHGSVEAHFEAEPFHPEMPFAIRAQAARLDLEKMSQDAPRLQSSGTVDGHLELAGCWKNSDSFEGKGDFKLQNGLFKGLSVLQSIGQTFQISELTNFRFEQVHLAFKVAQKKILLEDLQASGADLSLSASGAVAFDHQLALQVHFGLPERMLRGKALQLFQDRFSAPDETGKRSISFEVAGTSDKPRMNLFEKLVGEGVGSMIDKVLGGFIKVKRVDSAPPKDGQGQKSESAPDK